MALILVIDDDEGWRTVVREVLRLERHEVVEAVDGGQGVDLCRRVRPQLVITDIVMPDKEGLETIEEIHNEFPKLPIIAMSGGGDYLRKEDFLPMAEQLGACATLGKPLSREALLQAVNKALALG
jgi:DNA-binding NtrC family response regulator